MTYALTDANAFYVNVERAMRPSLIGQPVVVCGSNDGTVVARSEEAKNLGVRMGQAWFEIRHLEETAGLIGLSANFALYGDLSDRLMSLIGGFGHKTLVYSVDEAFTRLDGIPGDLTARAHALLRRIKTWIGLPCCVGIASTMTMAKFANEVAKSAERKKGSYPEHLARVCNLTTLPSSEIDALMKATDVTDVWGVGPRIGAQLKAEGVMTALDLARMDASMVRRRWSIVLERTVRELQGVPCIPWDETPPPRKQLACTRSFGQAVTSYEVLREAVSEFATRVSAKLRAQGGFAGQILVFIRTSPFRPDPQYSRSIVVPLPPACSDTRQIVASALRGLRAIYQPGYKMAKAGVMLLDLQQLAGSQIEMALEEPSNRSADRLMQAVDVINDRWGKGTLTVATAKLGAVKRPWEGRQDRRSPEYTTRWSDLPIVRA